MRFRSAPPHGGRRGCLCVVPRVVGFDPRPRTGGDCAPLSEHPRASSFDPRPRTGGDCRSGTDHRIGLFRSAPPHGGRPFDAPNSRARIAVSIRAPARGATPLSDRCSFGSTVSIRAPARGATTVGASLINRCTCFDPRPRTGGDGEGFYGQGCRAVSIRAPARGATRPASASQRCLMFRSAPPHGGRPRRQQRATCLPEFRSAPPHGGRQHGCVSTISRREFRSAPPHGGRQAELHQRGVGNGFDPRPRTGGDPSAKTRGGGKQKRAVCAKPEALLAIVTQNT